MATGTASKGGEQGAGPEPAGARGGGGVGSAGRRWGRGGRQASGFLRPRCRGRSGGGAGPGAGSPCGHAQAPRWGPRPALPAAPRRVLMHGDGNHCAAPPPARARSALAAPWPREGASLTVGALRFHVEQEGRGWHFLFCPDGGHTPPTCLLTDCCGGGGEQGVLSSEHALGANSRPLRHGNRRQRGTKRDATSQKAEWVLRSSPCSPTRPARGP